MTSSKIQDNPWWPALVALAIVCLDLMVRPPIPDTPMKALSMITNHFINLALEQDPIRKPLQSFIIHMTKSDNPIVNFLDFFQEFWDNFSEWIITYVKIVWQMYVNVLMRIDFHRLLRLLLMRTSNLTGIPEDLLLLVAKHLNTEFESLVGFNLSTATQEAVKMPVNSLVTELDNFKSWWMKFDKYLRERSEDKDWILYQIIMNIDTDAIEELHEFVTSKPVLMKITNFYRTLRDLVTLTLVKPLPQKTFILKLDRKNDFFDNLVTAIAESVWLIVEGCNFIIRGGRSESRCKSLCRPVYELNGKEEL
ncbi:hypothetical protein CHUAL_005629 [Chamberlinius hualienensis]